MFGRVFFFHPFKIIFLLKESDTSIMEKIVIVEEDAVEEYQKYVVI